MTAFHDGTLALAPTIFVPFDAPADTATVANNLGTAGGTLVSTVGGVRQDRVGLTAFTKEVEFDGVDDYWSADATLRTAITAAATLKSTFTAAIWSRSTYRGSPVRTMFRLGNFGFGLHLTADNFFATYFDAGGTQRSETFPSNHDSGMGGGWQLGAIILDSALFASQTRIILARNGTFQRSTGQAAGSAIRTSGGATVFAVGRDGALSQNFWLGSLGPLMIWDRALNTDEFMTLYQVGLGIEAPRSIMPRRPVGRRGRSDHVQLRETA